MRAFLLSGFDRLVLRGTLRAIGYQQGMREITFRQSKFCSRTLGAHVEQGSRRLKEASLAEAGALERPVEYLTSSQVSKEEVARRIATQDRIHEGLVCVLTTAG